MFYGIISTFLVSIGTIYWKKALGYNVSPLIFQLLSFFGNIILIIFFISFSLYDFSGLDYIIFLLVHLVIGINFISTQIGQYVYKKEKISILTPYENLNSILSLILAFIIFSGEVSLKSFLLTLLAGIVVIFSSINFKTFKIPKIIKLFSFQQLLKSISLILIGYILKHITSIDYYIILSVSFIIILLFAIYRKKELSQIVSQSKDFYKYRFLASTLGSISGIIILFIIKDLGVTMSILLGYLYMIIILIFSYYFLGDKPSKKNILTTIVISILVGLGYYYK